MHTNMLELCSASTTTLRLQSHNHTDLSVSFGHNDKIKEAALNAC